MNIIFCNIAWMKNYLGITDNDKPINGGQWVKETGSAGERFNFRDYNGKCYGYVMGRGDLALEKHYENCNSHTSFINNVLVIWVATNESKETRIVGWYKNATVFRNVQYKKDSSGEDDFSYSIEADAKDCYLLPENKRTFPIPRASQSGSGTGIGQSNVWYAESEFAQNVLIPKVFEYIENYDGGFSNIVYTDEMLYEPITGIDSSLSYEDIVNKAHDYLDNENYLRALRYYNHANKIKEATDYLFNMGFSLYKLNCFNKAIDLFEKLIKIEGFEEDTLINLMDCYELVGDLENLAKYMEIYLNKFDVTDEDKIAFYCSLFDIYMAKHDIPNAEDIIKRLSKDEINDSDHILNEMKILLAETN
ncbi:MAG: tetratricopeptide repeat protein [Vulcanibacillus sp.]